MSITADMYCEELNTMMKFARLQPILVNHSSPLLLHDTARPNTVQQTVSKLQDLGLGAPRHPLTHQPLQPTFSFLLFQNIDNLLAGKKI